LVDMTKILKTWHISKLVKSIAKTGNMIAELKHDIKKLEDTEQALTKRLRRVMKQEDRL